MKITIERIDNGYVLTDGGIKSAVVERDVAGPVDCEAVQTLLYMVLDALGAGGSKHDEERVTVVIKKRDV